MIETDLAAGTGTLGRPVINTAGEVIAINMAASGGGALVQRVAAGSPAEQAGIQSGDVITGVADRPVEDADDVLAIVMSSGLGDEVPVTFTRDGSDQTTTVTLGQSPADS